MALTVTPAELTATALTLTTAAQPNITSVGTLSALTVSGNLNATLTTAAQTNITSVGTLTSLTTSGNVSIGNSSPVTWHSGWEALQIGERAVFFSQASTTAGIGENVYYNSGWKAIAAAAGSLYQQDSGNHHFYTQASVSAGATASPNEKFTILNSGNVGIGVTTPGAVLSLPAGESNTPRFAIESAVDDNDFTITQYEDGNGTYTMLGQNVKLNSGGNNTVLDSGHRTAGIVLDSRNHGAITFITGAANTATEHVKIDSSGTLKVGVVVPTATWDANLDAIQVGEASAFRSGDSDYSAATVMSTNLYQTGGGDKLLNSTDLAAQYTQQGGNHYFYGYNSGTAGDTPAVAANDLANPLVIAKGGGLSISGGTVGNTANGKAGIFWHTIADGADYCIRRTNDTWAGPNYAQLLLDWETGVKIDVGADAYGKSFLEVVGSIATRSAQSKWNLGNLSASGRWDRSVLANLHPSFAADGTHIADCNDARNLGIRSLYHSNTSTNRPTSYGIIWAQEHYVGDSGRGSAFISQVAVAHSGTPSEYRRNTDTGSGTSFSSWYSVDMTSTSDIREKKNIVDAPAQLDLLKQVKVREFDYINDVEPNKELGMIAQELETILPKYVEKGIDKEGALDEDVMWRVHYKKMIPMLIKSIQEQQELIETLQTKVAALEK